MFTYEYVLAAVLITAPMEPVQTSAPEAWFEPLHTALLNLAMDGEILDPREKNFFLVHAQDFGGDVKMLQGRFQDLANAPLVEEALRFPDRKLVNDFLAFNRAYRNDLICRLAVDPVHAEELRHALQQIDQLYQIWDAVRDARCEYYYVTVRRQALMLLRDLVGLEAFYSGRLPPHVPVWLIPENN